MVALSEHEAYIVSLLKLAESGAYGELKREVQDELGRLFRGIIKGEVRQPKKEGSKKESDILPAKAIHGGVYVICYRDQDEGSTETPLDLTDLPAGKWIIASGQQAGRLEKAATSDQAQSKQFLLQKFRYTLKREGGRGKSAQVYQLADAYGPDERRCRLVEVSSSFQHRQSPKPASRQKGMQIAAPDVQQPLQSDFLATHAPASSAPMVNEEPATSLSAQRELTSKTTPEPLPMASTQQILAQDESKTTSPGLGRSDTVHYEPQSPALLQPGLDEDFAKFVQDIYWSDDEICDQHQEHELKAGRASKRPRTGDEKPGDVTRGEVDAETESAAPSDSTTRILVLHYTPADTKAIDFEKEMREIKNALQICGQLGESKSSAGVDFNLHGGKFKQKFDLECLPNVSLRLLNNAVHKSLKEGKIYNYIQFSGHGFNYPSQTLAFAPMDYDSMENGKPKKHLADNKGFAKYIRTYNDYIKERHGETLRGVVLNCCHGVEQGQALRDFGNVPYVIAHDGRLSDDVAITFSRELWSGIAAGNDMKCAFDFANRALDAYNFKDHHYKLLERPVNPLCMTVKPTKKAGQEIARAASSNPGCVVDREEPGGGSAKNFVQDKPTCQRDVSCFYLPSGAGNSAAAFELMHEFAKHAQNGERRVLFLAPSVSRMFEKYNAFKIFAVATTAANNENHCRSLSAVAVDKSAENQFIFLTGGLFYYLLKRADAQFSLSNFSLIVFDEAYHREDDLDYSRIRKECYLKFPPVQRSRRINQSVPATESLAVSLESDKVNLPDPSYNLYVRELLPAARPTNDNHSPEVVPKPKLEIVCFEHHYLENIVLQYLNQKVLRYMDDSDKVAAHELRGALTSKIKTSSTHQNHREPTMSSWICSLTACEEIKQRSKPCACVLQHTISIMKCFSYHPDIGSLVARKEAVQACFFDFVQENSRRETPRSSQESLFDAFVRGAADDALERLKRFSIYLGWEVLHEENLSVLRKVCERRATHKCSYTQIMHELNQTKLNLELDFDEIKEAEAEGTSPLFTYVVASKKARGVKVGDPGSERSKKAAMEQAAKNAIFRLRLEESLFLNLCKAAKISTSNE